MNRILPFIIAILTFVSVISLTGCREQKTTPQVEAKSIETTDSLEKIIAQRDNELNDMMATFNQIEEGFRKISEAENRVTIEKDGESADRGAQIRENIQLIAGIMKSNRELIKKLQTQVRESSFKGSEMQKTISNLLEQLDDKDRQLQQLRAELDAKDIHITELDETINNLNTNVANLTTEGEEKNQTIDSQDKQLNTAWFVFGTKDELKEQNILDKGKVLQGNFNKSYFTKIDIRIDKEIKLFSRSARILTTHPSGSYTLTTDARHQYVLRITNPQIFWSTSKYLVILVK